MRSICPASEVVGGIVLTWTLFYNQPNQHRLFVNEAGEISICGESGDNPDLTDDGPLIVEPTVELWVFLRQVGIGLIVAVDVTVQRTGGLGKCWVHPRVAMALRKKLLRAEVFLSLEVKDMLKIIKQLGGG